MIARTLRLVMVRVLKIPQYVNLIGVKVLTKPNALVAGPHRVVQFES